MSSFSTSEYLNDIIDAILESVIKIRKYLSNTFEYLHLTIFAILYRKNMKIKINYGSKKRNPLFVLIVVIIFLFIFSVALQKIPEWQVSKFEINDPIVIAQLENSYRATLAQVIGGFTLLLGLYFTWKNVMNAKESQITESYTRAIDQIGAIDQLGSPAIEIRLGGIYALERISAQSKKDHWRIIEILIAFIRINSPIENEDATSKEIQNRKRIRPDIQAILTVIGRRNYCFLKGEPSLLDLQNINLQGADLILANLEGAIFISSNLSNANLKFANLKDTSFDDANLSGADFRYSDVERASFKGATLKNANLRGVRNLSYNQLVQAKTLQGAEFNKRFRKYMQAVHPDLLDEISDDKPATEE